MLELVIQKDKDLSLSDIPFNHAFRCKTTEDIYIKTEQYSTKEIKIIKFQKDGIVTIFNLNEVSGAYIWTDLGKIAIPYKA
jgi:ABC-type taurine transport system substrate-binding protein